MQARRQQAAAEMAAAKAAHAASLHAAAQDLGLQPQELRNRRALMQTMAAWITTEIARLETLLPPTRQAMPPDSPGAPGTVPTPGLSPVSMTAEGRSDLARPSPAAALQAVPVSPDDVPLLTVDAAEDHIDADPTPPPMHLEILPADLPPLPLPFTTNILQPFTDAAAAHAAQSLITTIN